MDNVECLKRIELLEKQIEENKEKIESIYTALKLNELMEMLNNED